MYFHFVIRNICLFVTIGLYLILQDHKAIASSNLQFKPDRLIPENILNLPRKVNQQEIVSLPYFPKIYDGLGIEHMNVNLVNLAVTGLLTGDEIGVFDGIYCVGAMVITQAHVVDNSVSIPSSANDADVNNPNGFIVGHKISLKVYRNGKVYLLYFQTVNNTKDIFEKGGSMFAMVDLSRSTGLSLPELSESIKAYPNPFSDNITIEIDLTKPRKLSVTIFDINGNLVRSLFEGSANGPIRLTWNGKDDRDRHLPKGVYFCRVNETIVGIIYQETKIK